MMRSRLFAILALLALVPVAASAQQATRTEPVEALRDNTPQVHAFTGARIVVAPGRVLENATLVIRNGLIEAVGTNVQVPADARVWDMTGQTLYPGFIDAHADLELDEAPGEDGVSGPVHWNPQVRSFFSAADNLRDDVERRADLRAQGITTAHAVPRLGIFRGRTAVVSLGDEDPGQRVVRRDVAQSLSLNRSFQLGGSYPNSPMGAIALIRQTFLDSEWYPRAWSAYQANPRGLNPPETNLALDALQAAINGGMPVVAEAGSEEEIFRIQAIAAEFPINVWVRGNGNEYQVLDVLGSAGLPLILPLDFPEAPDVDTAEEAMDVGLSQLRHWYLAPENPARVAAVGVEFALTSDGIEPEDFLPNLRRAVARGLDPQRALAALTTVPARMLGVEASHGSIEAGKRANVIVVEGDIFANGGIVRDVWVEGLRYAVSTAAAGDPRGTWTITSNDEPALNGNLVVEGTLSRPRGTITLDGREVPLGTASIDAEEGRLRLSFPGTAIGIEGRIQLSASVSGQGAYGFGELPDGRRINFRAERSADFAAAENGAGESSAPPAAITLANIRPAMEFGRAAIPEQPQNVLVQNATVWTQGPQGKLENADLLVTNGRIAQVGQNLNAPSGAVVIDGTGKHVTPGLIDAHLHSGTSGTNESGFAIVPEVRMGDVVTHNTRNMYLQLAGGLTAAHVMHGSANPIGGQNVFMKMRWGALPEQLKLADGPRTVKFALGENPKRREGRYPDTRMGTQEIIRDHFMAARDYERAWTDWERTGEGIPPRRDLRMEAIADMLNGEIKVHSHGYRQDEFLALIRLAEEFGFSIGALQHGVEAYKIAPELAASNVPAVVWSDWSSFKMEAYDGTIYNARILLEAGVLTSLHSDNSAIASRMNWEAGKVHRTGVDEEDALSLVTNRTAQVFGVDDRIGSLETGKDADFVIWNGHPLSQFTMAEQTWIDGRRYFDRDEDAQMREQVSRERARLIQLLLNTNGGGADAN
ncbi:MAG: amidohydrolase family protein [Gemmatimonadota bacterium]